MTNRDRARHELTTLALTAATTLTIAVIAYLFI